MTTVTPLDLNRVGPGAWYMIHMMCANAKTSEEISSVHNVLEMVSKYFFCLRCREHFRSNMERFPPPTVNKYDELFVWSVEIHNKVNSLNAKPLVDSKDVEGLYMGDSATCIGDCAKKAKENKSYLVSEVLLNVLTGQADHIRYI